MVYKTDYSITEKFGGTIYKESTLKPKLDDAAKTLRQPIFKLDSMARKLAEKDSFVSESRGCTTKP